MRTLRLLIAMYLAINETKVWNLPYCIIDWYDNQNLTIINMEPQKLFFLHSL